MTLAFKWASRNPSNACSAGFDRLSDMAGGQTEYFSVFFKLGF